MVLLRRTLPIAVLLVGCLLLGAGVAGVARMDAPLRAAVNDAPSTPPQDGAVDVTWRHHHHRGDCPPGSSERT